MKRWLAVRARIWWLVMALAVLLGSALHARPAAAHPLGNFTISRYARVEPGAEHIRVVYAIDMAEIPAYQEGADVETSAYLDRRLPELARGLQLTVGGARLPLVVESGLVTVSEGQGGLPVLRIDAVFTAALPDRVRAGEVQALLRDTNYEGRRGWQEIVVRGTSGAAVRERSVPARDVSDTLRSYPADRLERPLTVREARFSFVPGVADPDAGAGVAAPAPVTPAPRAAGRGPLGGFARAAAARELTPVVALVTLLAAVAWGALHALGPGHGKTIVAAYLTGTRGTAWHALILGLTVTATHTAGVYLLGVITLSASRFIVPEDLYPVLSLCSGLLVVAMGLSLLWARWRGRTRAHDHHHDHPHPHEHPHAHRHSLLPVVWLGVIGGMIPCPTAIVVLLTSISLGRVGYGMVLVAAFSAGLAAVLTGIGLLLVYARHRLARVHVPGRVARAVPLASAAVVVAVGVMLTLNAGGAG